MIKSFTATKHALRACALLLTLVLLTTPATAQDLTTLTTRAEQGDVEAQFKLRVMYDNGQGVPQDNATAAKWFTKAAEQGHANAQYNLGVMYDNGRGIPQDEATAVKWFTKAAEQGDADAQFKLALMYANGRGVPQDEVTAHMWSNLAAAQGHKDAIKFRDNVTKRMTPARIAQAQEAARACVAREYKGC